jgi:hypothetical protein
MKGWKTRTFMDTVCLHQRKVGTAEYGTLRAWFRLGVKDYSLGGHPVWETSRVLYRLPRRPLIVGGLALGVGYFWATVRRVERPIPPEVVAFHRQEQMRRLKSFFGLRPMLAQRRT